MVMNCRTRSQPFSKVSQCSSTLDNWENFHNVLYSLARSIINTTYISTLLLLYTSNRSSSAPKMAYKPGKGDNCPKTPVLLGCFRCDITCEIDVFTCDLKVQCLYHVNFSHMKLCSACHTRGLLWGYTTMIYIMITASRQSQKCSYLTGAFVYCTVLYQQNWTDWHCGFGALIQIWIFYMKK